MTTEANNFYSGKKRCIRCAQFGDKKPCNLCQTHACINCLHKGLCSDCMTNMDKTETTP